MDKARQPLDLNFGQRTVPPAAKVDALDNDGSMQIIAERLSSMDLEALLMTPRLHSSHLLAPEILANSHRPSGNTWQLEASGSCRWKRPLEAGRGQDLSDDNDLFPSLPGRRDDTKTYITELTLKKEEEEEDMMDEDEDLFGADGLPASPSPMSVIFGRSDPAAAAAGSLSFTTGDVELMQILLTKVGKP